MKTLITRTATLIAWIGIAVIASVLYGVINNQLTLTISNEYYSVFKLRQFGPALEHLGLLDSPTRIQAVAIGIMSTWWFGLFLGIVLGISSMIGRGAPLPTRGYVRCVGRVMTVALGISVLSGGVAYILVPLIKPDSAHWPFLDSIQDTRKAFSVGWWHNGAYLGALVGTILASLSAQKQRRVS